MAPASCCGFLATIVFTAPVWADEGQRIAQLEIAPDTSLVAYHRSGDSRSPTGIGFGFGMAARGYWRNFGGALAYAIVPRGCTSVGWGTGPTVHFVDVSASFVTDDDVLVLDVGPSFAAVEHTYTNGEPSSGPSLFASSSTEDVPAHATAGAHFGAAIRLHVFDAYFLLGVSYRGGVPIGAWDARYEGAFFVTFAVGFEIAFRRGR